MTRIYYPIVSFLLLLTAACTEPGATRDADNAMPADSIAAASDAAKAADANKPVKVIGKEVTYQGDSIVMKGYLAFDINKEGKRPGVLVVHEWWGHNEHSRATAEILAEAGYTALAVDMYGNGKKADHPDNAGAFSSAVMSDFDGAQERFNAAKALLMKHPSVDTSSVGAVGYCFGGGVVLNMARQSADLDAVVSIHGSLNAVQPATPGDVKANILVLTGAADPFVPQESVDAFKQEMDAANANYEVVSYEGATHAFSNPKATEMGEKFDLPLAYDAQADSLSRLAMKTFFEETLR
jgi:dienelactone hydrolase